MTDHRMAASLVIPGTPVSNRASSRLCVDSSALDKTSSFYFTAKAGIEAVLILV